MNSRPKPYPSDVHVPTILELRDFANIDTKGAEHPVPNGCAEIDRSFCRDTLNA